MSNDDVLTGPKKTSFYPDDARPQLDETLRFCFGSNLAGRHGKGTALEARQKYGAVYGVGSGPTGRAYAIATKKEPYVFMTLDELKVEVAKFMEYNRTHEDEYFYICHIGTNLAGFKIHQVAPLFKGVQRAWLPESWRPYVQEQTSRTDQADTSWF